MTEIRKKDDVKEALSELIPVACVSDHRYVCGLLTTLWSLCRAASGRESICFYIFDLGLTSGDRRAVERLLASFRNVSARAVFHVAGEERFKAFPPWHGSWGPYVRLILQDELPAVDFAVYTDLDTLWLRDVGELWALREADVPLCAVPDGSGVGHFSGGARRTSALNMLGASLSAKEYFCSGLLLLNLRLLRAEGFTQKAFDFLSRHIHVLKFPDQDCYNFFFPFPGARLLDWRWGEFSAAYGWRERNTPRVIHFANDAPWLHAPSLPGALWWRAYAHACAAAGRPWCAAYAWMQAVRHAVLATRVGFVLCRWPFWLINRKLFYKRFRRFHPQPKQPLSEEDTL